MGHRTTVVELVIEPSDLSAIIQEWVEEEKFSVYEKGETRTIYSKMKGLSTAWLSVENNGKKTRIEAWLSQKGVGADFVGNAWVGWKVAVRKRSVLGGVRAYRKQFEQLLQGLQAKSESMVEREVASLDQNHSQPVIKKSVLVTGLVILGALSFVGGLSGVINARGIVLLTHARFCGDSAGQLGI